jgi:exosortase/archaeosortase family protein
MMQHDRMVHRVGISQWMKMISPEVISFLKAAVLMFFTWKIVYALVLQPSEIPDGWLVRSLASSTTMLLNVIDRQDRFSVIHARRQQENKSKGWEPHAVIFRNGKHAVLGIHAPCNGLELMVLAAGFIICLHGPVLRKMIYVVFAVVGVFTLNIIRCCLLAEITLHHPVHFDLVHKYLFNIVAYIFIFFLWMSYVPASAEQPVLKDDM